ncbi:hypothetical protein EGR_10615 [Echinococcus granulosus]|uniref:Uncharacterized protein n=1 Tax=Echinococcus granulosus TaxID=6210 RepID=W6U1X9_ECHGR|nr:hypothetical protein EGR_10615 [Echinococcus granulosus]EUB54531.1 hypothetical protein EGR_10615 [Echinococcus granulosus]
MRLLNPTDSDMETKRMKILSGIEIDRSSTA